MPWDIKRDPQACSPSKPFAVRNTQTGRVEACHATEQQARRHLMALYANVPEARD